MALVRREELHRARVYALGASTCDWCGAVNWTPRKYRSLERYYGLAPSLGGRAYLYRYWIESEGARVQEVKGKFCGESCRKLYQGEEGEV